MKKAIISALFALAGRSALWRLGRALYMAARRDVPNDMALNGEAALQRQALERASKTASGLVVFDVGANVGDWTASLLQAAQALGVTQLQVHAFEPVPSTFEKLKARHAAHPTVRLVNAALSSQSGTVTLYVAEGDGGTNSVYRDSADANRQPVEVSMHTAAAYCAESRIAHVDLLKCDTEGHDMEVLYGARGLFEAGRVSICQFEYNHRWVFARHYLRDAFDFAAQYGYRVGKLVPEGIEVYADWHPELERFFEGNYVLLHAETLTWLSVQRGTFDDHGVYTVGHMVGG